MSALTRPVAAPPAVAAMMPQSMDQAFRFADMMATASLVPQHLRNKPGDCLLVIEQATRWRMSPFAVAQATSLIQGKLMYEGKLVAAALHTSGALASRLDYAYDGEADARAVTVSACRVGETEPRSVRVTLAEARTPNKVWATQPDQQLAYHGARVWARRWAPEVILGVYAPEEFADTPPPAPPPHDGPTIEATPEPAEHVAMATMRERLAKCQTQDDAVRLMDAWRRTCAQAVSAGRPIPDAVKQDVADMINARADALKEDTDAVP